VSIYGNKCRGPCGLSQDYHPDCCSWEKKGSSRPRASYPSGGILGREGGYSDEDAPAPRPAFRMSRFRFNFSFNLWLAW